MPKKMPPRAGEEPTPFITGGDWSVGINSPTSLSQAELLTVLGRGLQKLYDGLLEEGTPEHLAPLVEQLEKRRD